MTQQRVAIDISKKQEAITWIEKHGEGIPSRAAVHFRKQGWNVDAATFRKWWRNRDDIMSASPHQKRLKGGGRKPVLGALEDLLLDAIINRRLRKEKVTRDGIASAALQIYSTLDSDGSSFTASAAWVSKFMKRNDLSLRRRTNLTVLTDDVLVERAVSYMRYLGDLRTKCFPEHTVLMNETAMFFEDARDTTVDVTGARYVVVRSTGFASMGVTVVLAVTATCRKLTPLVIWKHKQGDRSITTVESLWVSHQPKGWVDSELILKWIDKVFTPVMVANGKTIVWDSMRAHVSKKVKAKCSQRSIAMAVVPGGLTPHL